MAIEKKGQDHLGLKDQIFSIPLDAERYLIYAPLRKIAFIANSNLVNAVALRCSRPGRKSKKLAFLENLDFFTPLPLPPDEYLGQGVQYDSVILFLTNQCNLHCRYCYAHSGEYPKKQMNWEIAQAAIDRVLRSVKENRFQNMVLGFHGGGEPTLNWEILTRAVTYAVEQTKKMGVSLQVSGAFNGYWPKRVQQFVLHNFTEISLSFDGLPEVQNRQRPAAGQKDSFNKVSETLRLLDQHHFSYGIRMTVTNASVSNIAQSIAYICNHFRPKKIQVEPVFEQGRALQNQETIKDLNTFASHFILAFPLARDRQIELFYSGARLEILTIRFCLAACRALVVTTDGDITTCFESYGKEHPLSPQFLIGTYRGQGKFVIDEKRLLQYFKHTVYDNPHCRTCFCKWHCAGDCAIKSLAEAGNAGYKTTERCYLNQELTKFLILDRIKQSDGLIWNENEQTGSGQCYATKESIEHRLY